MDFTYDDEQQALREAVRGLLATAYADHEARRRTVADDPGFDRPCGAGWPRWASSGCRSARPTAASAPGPSRSGSCARSWAACSRPSPTSRRSCTPAASSPPSGPPSSKADLLGRLSAGEIVLARGRHLARRSLGLARGRRTRLGVRRQLDARRRRPTRSWAARPPTSLVVTAALPDGGTGVFVVDAAAASVTGYVAADLTRAASVRLRRRAPPRRSASPAATWSPSIATMQRPDPHHGRQPGARGDAGPGPRRRPTTSRAASSSASRSTPSRR